MPIPSPRRSSTRTSAPSDATSSRVSAWYAAFWNATRYARGSRSSKEKRPELSVVTMVTKRVPVPPSSMRTPTSDSGRPPSASTTTPLILAGGASRSTVVSPAIATLFRIGAESVLMAVIE